MRNNKKGFTLVELLVVIAIIGLLSTLAVVALNNARQKSRDARRVSDVKQIQTALELYYNDQGGYPTQAAGDMTTSFVCLSSDMDPGFDATCAGTTYMQKVPSNPTPNDGGGPYRYTPYTTGDVEDNNEYFIEYYIAGDTGGVTGEQWNTACSAGFSGCTIATAP